MLGKITLKNFKNFRDATLSVGGFSVIVGTNASGKSNIRDAFRFIHAMARGYTLSEILGEKRGDGGELLWSGIRGGTREVAFHGQSQFTIETALGLTAEHYSHTITVDVGSAAKPPHVVHEALFREGSRGYETVSPKNHSGEGLLQVQLSNRKNTIEFPSGTPVLTQVANRENPPSMERAEAFTFKEQFDSKSEAYDQLGHRSMRFIDLVPDSMRRPSLPGQIVLGDRGDDLSSVLQAICEDERRKAAMLEWIHQLTPLDLSDFEFTPDQSGRILVTLVEANGNRTSVFSASDGTLRFLAILALFFGPKRPRLLFFDEIETGIHPTRLHLLVELIEQQSRDGGPHVIATTNSPQLLQMLSENSRKSVSLVYRLEGQAEAHIVRIIDIPESARVLERQPLSRLHESGWLENAASFMNGQKEVV